MDLTPTGLWREMGPIPRGVVIVLIAMSMYALALSIERLLAYRRSRRQSIGYIRALQTLLGVPGRLHEAVGLERHWGSSPVARVIAAGLGEYAQRFGAGEAGIEGAGRSMERSKEREVMGLRRGLPGLATISSSAPFVGLLGTVFGIITAFGKMSDPNAAGGLASVSGGIAEALVTTAVGLTVAIISVWFYNYFSTRVDHLTVDVEETAGEVLECMRREQELRGR